MGEGGEKKLENGSYTFSFHVRLRFLVITPVFFHVETSLVEEDNPFNFYDGYQSPTTFNQLPENLMYLRLHSSKHKKIHPCEIFHYVNTCHLHIGQ